MWYSVSKICICLLTGCATPRDCVWWWGKDNRKHTPSSSLQGSDPLRRCPVCAHQYAQEQAAALCCFHQSRPPDKRWVMGNRTSCLPYSTCKRRRNTPLRTGCLWQCILCKLKVRGCSRAYQGNANLLLLHTTRTVYAAYAAESSSVAYFRYSSKI